MKLALPIDAGVVFSTPGIRLRLSDFRGRRADPHRAGRLHRRQPTSGTAASSPPRLCPVLCRASAGKVLGAVSASPPRACSRCGACSHYQRKRILTLARSTQDPLGAGYHIIQSTIRWLGRHLGQGLAHGTQAHLEFIPERHTDFIFAVYSEEFGSHRNGVLLVLYALPSRAA